MDNPKFEKGEKALAFYKGNLYTVRCLAYNLEKNMVKVHYFSYNSRYDEWVNADDVLKLTSQNLRKKEDLDTEKKKRETNKKRKSVMTPAKKKAASPQNITEVNNDDDTAAPDVANEHVPYRSLVIPDTLLKWLLFDHNQIEERGRKLAIPARESVESLIDNFYQFQLNLILPTRAKTLHQFVLRLGSLFVECLPKCILHKTEIKEYLKLKAERNEAHLDAVYSSFHLLRLIGWLSVKFSDIAPVENPEEFWNFFDDLLLYLGNNETELFRAIDYVAVNDLE